MRGLDVDWPRVGVHVVVVAGLVAFLTRPGSPGGRAIRVVSGGVAGLVAEAVA